MKGKKFFFIVLIFIVHACNAAVIIQGDDAPNSFSVPVTAQTFNRETGIFFVGLQNGAKNYALSKVGRPNFKSNPIFTGIATESTVAAYDNYVELLDHLPLSDGTTILAYVLDPDNTDTLLKTAKTINAVLENGQGDTPTEDLNDAGGDPTSGIANIAASSTHIFTAVRPDGAKFGNTDSGIALISVTRSGNTITLNEKDATTGLDGNLARRLDASSVFVKGNSGGNDVSFPIDLIDGVDVNENMVAMHWDPVLERLYIGLRIQSGSDANDIAKAVVAAHLVNGRLDLIPIVADSAIEGNDKIVVAKGANENVSIKQIRVMHTTTGPSYLIVNGGNGSTSSVGDQIFALPLVDKNDPGDVAQGTLADASLSLVNFKFDVAASSPEDLVTSSTESAIVGNCDLPITTTNNVIDMEVIDDTVYVSVAGEPNTTNDAGIFFSQALFDNNGKIIRWTPWKRAVPKNAFAGKQLTGSITHDGAVTFFAVDAKTGNITLVDGTTERTVGITSWTTTSGNTDGLITSLNKLLQCSTYSFLDLDQSTLEFLLNTPHRYALFGGINKVIFTRTSQAQAATCDSPQTVFTNFNITDDPDNILCTTLPSPGGCVQALEYSRSSTGYFFAGTENGLFVFSESGNSFETEDLEELNKPPFTTGGWTHIEAIEGSVIDLKTSGLALYVLTTKNQKQLAQSCENPLESTLYVITFNEGDTLATSFASAQIKVIAKSGTDPDLKNTILFSDIEIISTGTPADNDLFADDKEQLILATNNGLFKSNADQSGILQGIADATNQTNAMWSVVDSTKWYNFIGSINTPIQHTLWPVSIEDKKECKTFDQASVHQLSSANNQLNTENDPPFVPGSTTLLPICSAFNAKGSPLAFTTFDPITYFWSDGARRFFIFNRTIDPPDQTKLGVNPFNIDEWNISNPQILMYPVLNKIKRFYWIQIIGSNGLVLAGTEKGVVGLE